jgi:hypothetical protein
LEVESPTPVTKGRRGGRGAGARGGRVGACRWAVSGGGRTCGRGADEYRRGAGESYGGDNGRHGGGSRTLEEEEAGLLHFEVSSSFPRRPYVRGAGAQPCVSLFAGWRRPFALAKALRSDASVPTRRRSSRVPRAAGAQQRQDCHRATWMWPRGRSRKRRPRRRPQQRQPRRRRSRQRLSPPRAIARPWWRSRTTTSHAPDGANGRTGPC